MKRAGLTVILAMVLGFGLGAPWPAFADPGNRVKPPDKNRRVRDKGASRYALFAEEADALRKIETEDMVEVARQMYKLDPSAATAVDAVISEIQDARWAGGEEARAYRELLTSRASLCSTLVKVEELKAGVPGVYRQLLKDKEFSAIQREIRGFERQHPHRFCDYTDEMESVLDGDTVQEAHQNWHRRCKLVSRSIRSRGLLSGLRIGPGGKGTKGSETKQQESRPRKGSKAKPRVGGAPGRNGEKNETPKARPPAETQSTVPKGSPRKKSAEQDRKAAKPEAPQQARPLNEWERYVRDFIQRHDLTMSQRHSALSILRDLTFRADQIERSVRPRLAEAQDISDNKIRNQRIAALRQPIDGLFYQLQRRLDGLLTASQRSKATPKKK
jgi:hypothetical protein